MIQMDLLVATLLVFCAFASAQPSWENPVKKLLNESKPVIGATITVNSVDVAAQAANVGFDFLWIEMEHSPITLETLRNMVLATRGLKAVPFARVPINELWTAKRVLDAGALGVMFPFTSTPELAQQAVSACKYPPEGRRGSGPGLAIFRWPAPEGYHRFANDNVIVITVVEDTEGVENIEAIAATPGIDVIFIGTNDLSFSLGVGGQWTHPKVEEAIAKIVASAKRHNKFLGRPGATPEQIEEYMKQGFLFFQGPSDLVLMRDSARALLDPFGKRGVDPKARAIY
jgi:2-keto-3-deoxy-L-rhamnonate aldolase RhmA